MKDERNNDFQKHVPEIIFDAEPRLPEFVRFAWKCAADHIRECPGAPQARYMDEAFAPDRIWIWDTCFMALYCKYAQEYFPGIESLRNFYEPMLDGRPTPLKIHIPDNPPSSHGPNGNPGKPPETAVIWRRSSSTIAILSACSACSRVSKPDRVSTI